MLVLWVHDPQNIKAPAIVRLIPDVCSGIETSNTNSRMAIGAILPMTTVQITDLLARKGAVASLTG